MILRFHQPRARLLPLHLSTALNLAPTTGSLLALGLFQADGGIKRTFRLERFVCLRVTKVRMVVVEMHPRYNLARSGPDRIPDKNAPILPEAAGGEDCKSDVVELEEGAVLTSGNRILHCPRAVIGPRTLDELSTRRRCPATHVSGQRWFRMATNERLGARRLLPTSSLENVALTGNNDVEDL
ncbi:hypothetical protein BJ912DRAFT_1068025 [Pholiota molesta]|nr:hypothetical protein BJ912DRAFT_1068025 [Pholiota molesta]